MKNTGIIRQLDKLGRIVLPMELRKVFDISEGDYLEIYVENGNILLSKYSPSCIFCKSTDDILEYKQKNVCSKCITELSR